MLLFISKQTITWLLSANYFHITFFPMTLWEAKRDFKAKDNQVF